MINILLKIHILSVVFAFNIIISSAVNAADFSFAGTFLADDDVQLFNFTADAPSIVTLLTYSYAGGVQADGNIVSNGGFDPILALFDGAGDLIDLNDDGSGVPVDPNTGEAYDTLLEIMLIAGDYTVAIMQFPNVTLGSLSDGFIVKNDPYFSSVFGCSNGQFCDQGSNNRTNEWAFDILNVENAATTTVPVPAAFWLLGTGLLGLVVGKRITREK